MDYMRIYRNKRNRNTYKRRAENNSENIIFIITATMLITGAIVGAIAGNIVDNESLNLVGGYITDLLDSFDKYSINQKAVFEGSLLKYARVVIIMWASGFFIGGIVLITCLLFIKAFAYGFATASIIKSFGFYGFVIAASTYIPQNLFFLSALLFVSFNAINNIYKIKLNGRLSELPEYLFVFLAGILCCVISSLIETFLIPSLIDYIY